MTDIELGMKPEKVAFASEESSFLGDEAKTLLPEVHKAVGEVREFAVENLRRHNSVRYRFLRALSDGNHQDELDGWVKFMKKIEENKSVQTMQTDISSFRYGTDRSILRSASPEDVWNTIKRRYAWKIEPLRMIGLTFTQITLCVIVVISANSPINLGTLIMAALFISATGAACPLKISRDLIKYIGQGANKIGWVAMGLILLITSPILLLVFAVTFTLDVISGEIFDISYGHMFNIIVRTFVVFTAISVGLRSGNPINAIQTFAGFSFIDSMDEVVIDGIDFDFDELAKADIVEANSAKILFVRLAIYISTPFIIAGFVYITFINNNCYAFCDSSQ